MSVTLRCPTCGRTVTVRANNASAACAHKNTRHDAKKLALMVVVQAQLELKETA